MELQKSDYKDLQQIIKCLIDKPGQVFDAIRIQRVTGMSDTARINYLIQLVIKTKYREGYDIVTIYPKSISDNAYTKLFYEEGGYLNMLKAERLTKFYRILHISWKVCVAIGGLTAFIYYLIEILKICN